MLQDMRHTRGVSGRRAKADGIKVFAVVTMKVQNPGAGLFVLDFIGRYADIGNLFHPQQPESM